MTRTGLGRYESMAEVISSELLGKGYVVHVALDSRFMEGSVYKFSVLKEGKPVRLHNEAFRGTILEHGSSCVFHTDDRDLTPYEVTGALLSRLGNALLNESGIHLKRLFEATGYPHP